MPALIMANPYESFVTIWNNPQLDTSPILNECKRRKCPESMLEAIQQPFTCEFELPIPEGCRNVIGDFDMTRYDKSFNQVESIIGTITLKSSNLSAFPKMEKLRTVRQNKTGPLIIVENNPNLRDVKALYPLTLYTKNNGDAVVVKENPKLCITFAEMDHMFVLEYLGNVDRCSKL
ncbi:Receptor L domain protein [Trichostrongylus colubriformis]|uniref:Receptor L domain protein n=1 Tax=Trichostrongylus colubriformis TaxID=6319 RepID=A0AAN8F548_TRICO